jgi:hypothetical protein
MSAVHSASSVTAIATASGIVGSSLGAGTGSFTSPSFRG